MKLGNSVAIALTCILILLYNGCQGQNTNYADNATIPVGAASLAVVFDITGSMLDDLKQVIEGAAKILATTLAQREKPLYNYVLVPFHDPVIGPVVITTDSEKFQKELQDLFPQGGGDCPEMSVGAIKKALELSLPNSFIYVFTDARAKDYYLTEKVLALIQKKQSQVVFVMTGDCGDVTHIGYKAYEKIASTSSGQVFLLEKNQVDQVLNFVRVAVQARKVNLLSADYDKGKTTEYKLPVDDKLRSVTVSVSGIQPRISIKNPQGIQMEKSDIKELLNLNNVLIYNIHKPQPGEWTVQVSSSGQHTVRVTGLSALAFTTRFSRKPTNDFVNTQHRPIMGVPSNILVNVSSLDAPGYVSNLELMTLKGIPLATHPVKQDEIKSSVYNVSSVVLPDEFFYVKITGIDQKGFIFQRITATAIKPKVPTAPEVFMPGITKGYYGSTAVLMCKVESLVPFSVRWYKQGVEQRHLEYFSESSNATFEIPQASALDEGVYICEAANNAGIKRVNTHLDISEPPPIVILPVNASAVPGKDQFLFCTVISSVPDFNVTWYKPGTTVRLNLNPRVTIFQNGSLLIRNVKMVDGGFYICEAANEGGVSRNKTFLKIQEPPRARVIPVKQNFVQGQTVNFTCVATGYPKPNYFWLRSGKIMVADERITIADGRLSIREIQRAEEGDYQCMALNSAGNDSIIATLSYIEAPHIVAYEKQILVASGDTSTLFCTAEGIPKPSFRWFKGNVQLQELSYIQMTEEGELIILGTQDMDAGFYTCVATNEAGSDSEIASLKVGSEPSIIEAPFDIEVEIEKNASLSCSAIGLPLPQITWRRVDGKSIKNDKRSRQLPSGELFIENLQLEDEGMYTCIAQNQFGVKETSAFISVTGIVSPLIAYSNPYVDVIEGRPLQLRCDVLFGTPKPSIIWMKNGEVLPLAENLSTNMSATFSISNVQVSNRGLYTCLANNVGGNSTFTISVSVQVSPQFVDADVPRNLSAIQGSGILLPCQVTGDPPPVVVWHKDDDIISPTDSHYFLKENGNLEIFNVDPQDSGVYSCSAINNAGKIERDLTLFVKVQPVISGSHEEEHLVVVNSSVLLSCEVRGVPGPKVFWKRNFVHFDLESDHYRLEEKGLRIVDVKVSDQAIYECIASNVAGNVTKIITVIVQVPPSIVSTEDTTSVILEGESTVLRCETTGDPVPRVQWKKNGLLINIHDEDSHLNIIGTGSLSISPAGLSDAASYECTAVNPAGFVSRDFSLQVHAPPTLPKNLVNATEIIENNPKILSCPVKGTPPPTVFWYKDGVKLTGNESNDINVLQDGSLEFISVKAHDSGVYKCIAVNVAGQTSHDVILKVLVPPQFHSDDDGSGGGMLESTKVVINKSLTLRCPVEAEPPPKLTWLKDGNAIPTEDLGSRIIISEDHKSLVITKANLSDTARFTCVASNVAGTSEKGFDVKVQVPPEIDDDTSSLNNLSVVVGLSLFVDCPASGIPSPRVTWYKDEKIINLTKETNLKTVGDGRRLQLTDAKLSDVGRYKCVADNEAGFTEKEYDVEVHVPPEIEEANEIIEEEVVTNKNVRLSCPASGIPPPTITWYKFNMPIRQNSSHHSLLNSGNILEISNANVTDTARYVCKAENIAGNKEKTFDLNVLVPAKIDSNGIITDPRVIINQTVLLNCPASGVPAAELRWFKNDQPLNFSSEHIEILSGGRQIRIRHVQVTDTAPYYCVASNKAGEDSLDFNLQVLVPPKINTLTAEKNTKVVINNSVVITCPASGVPPPVIRWQKNGQPLTTEKNPNLRFHNDRRQLEIISAGRTDIGRYTCKAVNEAGDAELSFNLDVLVAPEVSETGLDFSPNIVVNRTATVYCPAVGNPQPTIRWLRNNQSINFSSFPNIRQKDEGRSLVITYTKVSDTAVYSCVATNEAGQTRKDFSLDVWVPPKIDRTDIQNKPKVVQGHAVIITCPVTGIPLPQITWLKDQIPLISDELVHISSNGARLKITNTTETDTGRYSCIAKNEAGEDVENFELNVLVPPSIDESNVVYNPRVIVSRPVILECPVSGTPAPAIHWLFDSLPLEQSDRVRLTDDKQIKIAQAQTTDTGRYTCIASNEAGELRRNFDLEVYVPPAIDIEGLKKEFTVIENRTVNIDCPVEGIPFPSIMWLQDRAPLLDFPYENIRVSDNGQKLQISNAQVPDATQYTCVVTNFAGQAKESFNLKVLVPPLIEDSGRSKELAIAEGEPLQLACYTSGIPTPQISWMKDNQPIVIEDNSHLRLVRNSQLLQVVRSKASDAAWYTCHAENSAGEAEKYFDVTVHVPPRINGSERIKKFSVINEKPLTLACPATGIPPPTITWLRDKEPIPQYGNPSVRILNDGRELLLANTQMFDSGDYACIASNVAGNFSQDFSVNVLVPPRIEDGPSEIATTLTSRTLLLCETFGIPRPTVQWEKDGRYFPSVGSHHRMLHAGTLEFVSIKEDDSGSYQCLAENEAGQAKKKFTLNVQVPPQITADGPLDLKVIQGNEVSLPCNVIGKPKPHIAWRKRTTLLSGDPGYTVYNNGTLKLHKADRWDSGIYVCIAQNNAGSAIKQIRLQVQVPPFIKVKKSKFTVRQGRNVILPCHSSGTPSPKIKWLKDGQEISYNDYHYTILRDGWLGIPFTRAEDAGIFTCVAENEAGNSSVSIQLLVQVPPNIKEEKRLMTTRVGEIIHIPCQATGYPPPKVTWKKDGRKVALRRSSKYAAKAESLIIYFVEVSDTGSYICFAKNEAGQDSQEVLLRVQVPPQFTIYPIQQEVLANNRFRLECAAEGIPVPSITWLRNNISISAPTSVNGRSVYAVNNAGKEDAGKYTCVAENPAGHIMNSVAVVIKVPPEVLVPSGSKVVTLAEKVILSCSAGGDPAPRILWTKNGRSVVPSNRIQQLPNGSLVIYNSTSSDAGEYKCVATNDAGSSEGIAMLTVRRAPSFKIEPRSTRIAQGDTVTMNCIAEGEPAPTITWKKGLADVKEEGRFTVLPNNSLRIVATQLVDSGLYRCLAGNYLGRTFVEANLTVVVDGMWSVWLKWGPCSVTCGRGTHYRIRRCNNPVPANGGRLCRGVPREFGVCVPSHCPVNGNWGHWLPWEECSTTCGNGDRVRSRICDNPPPQYGGVSCEGESSERVVCNPTPCPINGNWGEWSDWHICSMTCGEGYQERYRRCDSPQAQHGGRECPGSGTDRRLCSIHKCAVDGDWSSWSVWTLCSQSCAGGRRRRYRECDSPTPQFGGAYCVGGRRMVDYCNNEPCPVHGNWSPWNEWGACSLTCNEGQRKRFRTCTNPAPSNHGRPCSGLSQKQASCNNHPCPVHGQWLQWSEWSSCSKSCGKGMKERTRLCQHPQFGGQNCLGDKLQGAECIVQKCQSVALGAFGNVVGYVNNQNIRKATLVADISLNNHNTVVSGKISNVPREIAPYLRNLISILTPVYWTTAKEINGAYNGLNLTEGKFRREVQVEFLTGEILKMIHHAKGVDSRGNLQLDIILRGSVPEFKNTQQITMEPYREEYVQTGPGSIYAFSSRRFYLNGASLPYAWNHTINYDEEFGKMPYLVETLYADDVTSKLEPNGETISYQLRASIAPGQPSHQCPTGFSLDPQGPYCRDFDECQQANACSHYCHNAPGSYSCSCPYGYALHTDGQTCKDVDECLSATAKCSSNEDCLNSVGSYRCAPPCFNGFQRNPETFRCIDVDECEENRHNCNNRQRCKNTRGRYECITLCPPNYEVDFNGECKDINECLLGLHTCHHTQTCHNVDGGYHCVCPQGFKLYSPGQPCLDINECTEKPGICHYRCKNTFGSYECLCPPGQERLADRKSCAGIIYEVLGRTNDVVLSDRSHTQQKFSSCLPGYHFVNTRCIDIDECLLPQQCQHNCTNMEGSYLCTCPHGYSLRSDARSCQDIDECQKYKINCGQDQMCFNRRGDYVCVDIPCPRNYKRDPTTKLLTHISRTQIGHSSNLIASNKVPVFRTARTHCHGTRVNRCSSRLSCLGVRNICLEQKFCIAKCLDSSLPCLAGSSDIVEFRILALPSGIHAHQDLIRLVVHNQYKEVMRISRFLIIENDPKNQFSIRQVNGKGVVSTPQPLKGQEIYKIKVKATAYDRRRGNIKYQATFIVFISVSLYPY